MPEQTPDPDQETILLRSLEVQRTWTRAVRLARAGRPAEGWTPPTYCGRELRLPDEAQHWSEGLR